jgi:hypothetical protein
LAETSARSQWGDHPASPHRRFTAACSSSAARSSHCSETAPREWSGGVNRSADRVSRRDRSGNDQARATAIRWRGPPRPARAARPWPRLSLHVESRSGRAHRGASWESPHLRPYGEDRDRAQSGGTRQRVGSARASRSTRRPHRPPLVAPRSQVNLQWAGEPATASFLRLVECGLSGIPRWRALG